VRSEDRPARRFARGRFTKRLGRALLVLAALIGATVFVSGPAYSANFDLVLRNWETGLCLDSNDDGAVYTLACNGGNYQNWNRVPEDPFLIRNEQTRLCLESDQDGYVHTRTCHIPYDHQRWSEGFAPQTVLTNVATGWCLDSNHRGNVYTLGCNWAGFQRWKYGY
jgi:hypothetical protein